MELILAGAGFVTLFTMWVVAPKTFAKRTDA